MVLFIPIAVTSCKDEAVLDINEPIVGAKIRLYNFSIGAPSVNFYANDTKISAALSQTGAESINGVNFGGTYPANQYALAPGGESLIRATTSSTITTTTPNLTIASVNHNLVLDKYYSIFVSGIYNTTERKADAFVVEDVFPIALDTARAFIRIVNPCPNTTLKLVLTKTTTVTGQPPIIENIDVAAGVAYKSGSAFFGFKPGAYSITVTDEATGRTAIRAATSFLKERVYTLALRGNILTGTPATFIDNTVNK